MEETIDRALTDAERHPLLTADGRALLRPLLEHPHAPRWNHRCGDRLTREGLRRVRAWERALHAGRRPPQTVDAPAWAKRFARHCLAEVPFYRGRGGDPGRFRRLPTCDRADLGREPWFFVPDGQPLDELIVYNTSGTTGHPLEILSHPEVSSLYLPLLRAALGTRGVPLAGGAGRVSIVLVCAQRATYTYASISAYLGGAGFVKLNLDPGDWRDPEDRERFLDDLRPEICTGDPISLAELARLKTQMRPKAIVSTAMTLHDGLRERLESRFGCPVLDVYSLNECRLVGVATGHGHEVLAHDCHVEVLRPDGAPCEPEERGEITITCGRNPFLPLLRYRTGDFAAIDATGARPILLGLEGRRPVRFVDIAGRAVNSIDVSVALRPLALAQFTLHQAADRALTLRLRGIGPNDAELRNLLRGVFGDLSLTVGRLDVDGRKVVQYTSDLTSGGGEEGA